MALLASAGTGLLVWQLSRHDGTRLPEISAYSHGESVRVGPPYRYCQVLDLDNCEIPQTQVLWR